MYKYLILCGLLITSSVCNAKEIYYGDLLKTINIPYGSPTLVKFDEQIRTISRAGKFTIQPANKEDPDYSTVSVNPRFTTGSSKVAFILANDKIVRIKFVVVPRKMKDKLDPIIELKGKSSEIAKGRGKAPKITDIELLKAMIRDDKVIGFDRKVMNRSVSSGRKGISARILRHYKGVKLHGYVLEIKNHLRLHKVSIDPRKLVVGKPNLAILSQVDKMNLGTVGKENSSTLVRIVARASSRQRDILLPIGTKKTKGN